jgi:hypothetical protein
VPMLMCGFVRSNFAFATEAPPGCTPRRSRGFVLGFLVSWPV